MRLAPLACILLLSAALPSFADSNLYGFRESYRGTAVLSVGSDSLPGACTASFNASRFEERGHFAIDSVFHSGAGSIPLPSSLRFREGGAFLSLGSGSTAVVGSGVARIGKDVVKFSIKTSFLGAPATVDGKIKRTRRGLQFDETIAARGITQVLSFNLKSKQPPGSDSTTGSFDQPGGGPKTGSVPVVMTWGNAAASVAQRLTGINTAVRIEAATIYAYEKEGTPAVLRISRSDQVGDLAIAFELGGNPDPRKGSASPADYRLLDGVGNPIGDHVVIPAGTSSIDVQVVPVADGIPEVPETLTVSLRPSASYQLGASSSAAAIICDATPDPANDNIFIAYLAPVAGAASSATGISTVHLHGDNSDASVDLGFSGLSSDQSAAHISAPGTSGGEGPDIQGLARGQLVGSPWNIGAEGTFTTDQEVLDALYSGQLSMNVNTGNYPGGEIRGNYVMSTASADPPVPADPPAMQTLTGDALRQDVARFLMQATFGPTQAGIDALAADVANRGGDRIAAYSAWIDQQYALPQTRLLDYVKAADGQEWALRGTDPINYVAGNEPGYANRRRGWWTLAVKAGDELRQRVTFALSEIFVVSEANGDVRVRHYGAANYYDLLGSYAGGSYRALLGAISRHPIMGTYLNALKNQKAIVDATTGQVLVSPDENYAREVMQLFSIGLVQLNADGSVKLGGTGSPTATYSNSDVTELARVLTGWSFGVVNGSKANGYPAMPNTNFSAGFGPQYFQDAWTNPMINFAAYHDSGSKVVLGTAIPAGLTGDQDLDAALDILANHANVGPFICRQLIQRLVTSNPSAGYVYRVAKVFADDGSGQRGDLKAVVKAILLDYEARDPAVALQVGHGKQKEPMLRYVQLLRAIGASSSLPLSDFSAYGYPAAQLASFPSGTTIYRYFDTDTQLSQTPQAAPTVFNWFSPGYSPPGRIAAAGLVAPEMELTTETQVMETINFARIFTESDAGQSVDALYGAATTLDDVKIDRSAQVNEYNNLIAGGATVTAAVTQIVDDFDLLLTGGKLKERYATAALPNPRSIIIAAAVATTEGATSNDRVKVIMYLVSNSPTCIYQP